MERRIEFRFFYGSDALPTNLPWFDALCECFVRIFNHRGVGEWGESWTNESVRERYRKALSDPGRIPMVTLMTDGARVVGFLVGALVLDASSLKEEDFPFGWEGVAESDVLDLAGRVASLRFPLYSSMEFAIERGYRGGIRPIRRLFLPHLKAAKARGCRWIIGFSSAPRKSFFILRAFGGRVIGYLGGVHQITYFKARVRLAFLLARMAGPLIKVYMGAFMFVTRLRRSQGRA